MCSLRPLRRFLPCLCDKTITVCANMAALFPPMDVLLNALMGVALADDDFVTRPLLADDR
jgi:hypothetical protein